ncbi:NepR family anti-sigma factor [Neokomagataea tanensis]
MQDEAPFNVWLSRGLHRLFDDIANEPIPDELLKLIQNDKNIK